MLHGPFHLDRTWTAGEPALVFTHTPDECAKGCGVRRVVHFFDDASDIDGEAHLYREPKDSACEVEPSGSFDGTTSKEGAGREHAAPADTNEFVFNEREDFVVPSLHDLRHVFLADGLRVDLGHGRQVDHLAFAHLGWKDRAVLDLALLCGVD